MPQINAATETAVAQRALSILKETPFIGDLDTAADNKARVIKVHFAAVRDAVLRGGDWNCARGRTTLAALATAPDFGFKYQYALPADCVNVIWAGLTSDDENNGAYVRRWKVEGRSILTDMPAPLAILYTRRLEEVALWDAQLRNAIEYALAASIGPELCRDRKTVEYAASQAQAALDAAGPVDSAEGTPDDMPDGDILSARDY